MTSSIFIRLSVMMFLQFFVWGAWWVTLGIYMGTEAVGLQEWIFLAYLSQPIGAIISPFFLGMVADRFFATERVLGVLHLLGGVLLFCAPQFAEGAVASPWLFILFLVLHMLCFMPTMGLTNTLAFHNLTNQEKQFPYIRVFGTLGWIVAGIVVSFGLSAALGSPAEPTAWPLYMGAAGSILMGLYSMTLPHTPPPLAGEKVTARGAIGLDALSQLSSRPFWVFIVCSLLICIPLAAYYAYAAPFVEAAGLANPAFKMSVGQMSEVLFMLAMPLGFAYLGVKWMLFGGMLAWVLRYGLFALGAPEGVVWMIMLGVALHGICYDFFFVTGQIYVDKKAPARIRGQAQGFLVWATLGVGMFIGMLITGPIFNSVVAGVGESQLVEYRQFWIIPAAFAAVVMLIFAALFKDREVEEAETKPAADEPEIAEAAAIEQQP